MAGITNTAFRRLCRTYGPGLFVSEMITSRSLVERHPKTLRLIRFAPDETPRSVQLYGVDPVVVRAAVRMIVEEDLADHIDLNFGCPVPKVTRKGGGAALPWRIDLFGDIVTAAAEAAAAAVPITVKMRLGIDADHLTYREAGLPRAGRGRDMCGAARADGELTSTEVRPGWGPIAELGRSAGRPGARQRRHLGGRGRAADDRRNRLRRRSRRTWLPGTAVAIRRSRSGVHRSRPSDLRPDLREVTRAMRRHAELLAEWLGEERGLPEFRKHVAWYLKGYVVGSEARAALGSVSTLAELDRRLIGLDLDQPFPRPARAGRAAGRHRPGRSHSRTVGWPTAGRVPCLRTRR